MPTFESKDLVDDIIKNDGYYADDPRVQRITKYTSAWGGTCYGVEYHKDGHLYLPSHYVRNPEVIWEAK